MIPPGRPSPWMVRPAQGSRSARDTLIKWMSVSLAYSLSRLIREYWSTKPADMIPVGMATMPTPRKAIQMPKSLPIVVMG